MPAAVLRAVVSVAVVVAFSCHGATAGDGRSEQAFVQSGTQASTQSRAQAGTRAGKPITLPCKLALGPRRGVTAVVDAQTIQLDDGTFVRLTGALAPRVSVPHLPVGKTRQATPSNSGDDTVLIGKTRAALERRVLGRSVVLAYGTTRKDRYGHRLAQVFVLPDERRETPTGGIGQDEPLWLQGYLVAFGLARAYSVPGSGNCLSRLVELERRAIEAKLGLWAHAAFQSRSARRVRELAQYRSTFQIVEGRIWRVGRSRSQVYLNFGRNWRRDTTLGMDKTLARVLSRKLAAMGLDISDLEGRRVRIRGWIEMRNGPFITADDIGQIELLAE